VPIKDTRRVIGALSVDRLFEGPSPLEEDIRLLTIISSLVVQKVSLLEEINREREQLGAENVRLRRELSEKYSFSTIITRCRRYSTS
jgi:Nif-specific regulatory protein